MKRTLFATLLAAGFTAAFAAPAYSAAIPHTGDETDLSWQYLAPTAKPQFDGSAPTAQAPVRVGDENDASWEYQPNAKAQFESNVATSGTFVEFADENNQAWLYQAPSAGPLADAQRQHPRVGFESSVNPIAKVRQLFGRQASGE